MGVGVVVETFEEAGMVEQWRADRKLWLTAEKDRVVEDGHPEAAFLYVVEGHLVPRPEAEKLGAIPPKNAAEPKPKRSTEPKVTEPKVTTEVKDT